ncbi:MAG: pyridoxal phosphate-dependent aminotransferase [Cyclobacteriaceae bacterium]
MTDFNALLSDRILNMQESATLAMARKAREIKAQGIDIISLSIGEPDFKTPKHIQEAAKAAIDEGKYFGYPPVAGYQDLREAIANKLVTENNIPSKAENIVVSTGAKQSIANVLISISNPGDEIIILAPYWVSYSDIALFAGAKPVFVKGSIDNDFKATADQLKAAITPKTKAILFSSPSNPTGSVFTRDEIQSMVDVLAGHPEVMIISDEIYEYINFSGKHVSIGSFDAVKDRTITVNGYSKGFAMTGWRIGYISAPVTIAKACEKVQGQITSGANSIAQRASLAAIKADKGPTEDMKKEYLRRRDLMLGWLAEIPGVKTYTPSGAFYIFPDISDYFGKSNGSTTINNASDLSLYLLENANVSVVTGDAFGAPEAIRISYAASEEQLKEAINRIAAALGKLN